jgi:ferric-dicitrate binding protein FerR (iron transport regulator)
MATLRDGLVPGGTETLRLVCAECDYQGMPLEFAERPDYEEFRESLRGAAGHERTAREAAALSDASGEASWEAAERAPPLQVDDQRPMSDRLRIAPLLWLFFGAAALVLGLLMPWLSAGELLYTVLGVALLAVGWRAWKKR